jgi:hypothetical protein
MKTNLSLSLFSPLLLLTLAACATASLYRPLEGGEGYSEQKLEANRFRVSYAGNSSTPRQTVENYLLYRAAEITLSSGHDYFVMANQSTEADTSYSQTVSGFGGFGRYSWSPLSSVGVGVGTAIPSTEYEAQAYIVMYSGKKPPKETQAFDAREVKANLEPLIVRTARE